MSPDIFTPTKTDLRQPVHFLSSFCENPQGVSFQNQEHDEAIILFLRKHFITNIPWIATTLLLIILPLLLPLFFMSQGFPFNAISAQFKTVVTSFYYLIVFAYAFINFITWYYDVFIVTQKRVVDIDFSDLIYHHMAITKIELIQDVTYNQSGFLRSLFDYGNLFIQTAGNNPNFDDLAIPQPARAANIISNLIGK